MLNRYQHYIHTYVKSCTLALPLNVFCRKYQWQADSKWYLLWVMCACHYKLLCVYFGLEGHIRAKSHSSVLTSFQSHCSTLHWTDTLFFMSKGTHVIQYILAYTFCHFTKDAINTGLCTQLTKS